MKITKINIHGAYPINGGVTSMTCPHCGQKGSFDETAISDLRGSNRVEGRGDVPYLLGIRKCPNPRCRGQVFIQDFGGQVDTFPGQVIDFDASDVPENIVAAFEEALLAEANGLYVSAAIMVRKTLELICNDRGATGKDLKNRIQNLQSQVTLPPQLFSAMDNLRLLGNDAAHINSQVFDDVGNDELEIAIDITKEILKSIYQLDSIVNRLESLKSIQSASNGQA